MLYIKGRVSPGYRRRSPSKKRKGRRRAFFLLFCTVVLFCVGLSEWGLSSVSEELTKEAAKSYVASCMREAVEEALSEDEGVFTRVNYDAKGAVSAVSADTAALNRVKASVLEKLEEKLNGRMSVSVPIGSMTDVGVFNGRGFSVPLKLKFEGSADVSFDTSFESAGINQSCHRITMVITASVYSQSKRFEVYLQESTGTVLSETVVVGAVPDIASRVFENQQE